MDFQDNYGGLSNDELLMVAASRRDLVDEAAHALDAEMVRRHLTYEDAHAKKWEIARLEIREERNRQRVVRRGSKYFVYKATGWMPLLVGVGVPLCVVSFLFLNLVSDAWVLPIFLAAVSSGCAVIKVQPWLRRTFSFWLSLSVSFSVQLFVSYWLGAYLSAHQARKELSWIQLLPIILGYGVGILTYVLLQKSGVGEESST